MNFCAVSSCQLGYIGDQDPLLANACLEKLAEEIAQNLTAELYSRFLSVILACRFLSLRSLGQIQHLTLGKAVYLLIL